MLQAARHWLDETQAAARQAFLTSKNPQQLTATLSAMLDQLITRLYEWHHPGSSLSVIAVGGYGRNDQCPHSDVDILFLYPDEATREHDKTAEAILYSLWDMGFKVGHAQRTIDEALHYAHEDTHVCTSMLDARLVCGSKELYQQVMERFWTETVQDSTLSFVEAKLQERDRRHMRFGDSRYRLEPNVKEGKGGLRDLHTLWWLARYVYRVTTLEDMTTRGYLTQQELDDFRKAAHFLQCVRILLHYHSGFADDRLTFDKQHAIAKDMGFDHTSPNLSITRFMRRYFMAAVMVGSLTRIICALLEDEKKRKPQRPLGWASVNALDAAIFKLEGERLNISSDDVFTQHPVAIISLFHIAQEQSLDIHPHALRALNRCLHLIDGNFRENPEANQLFLRILSSDKNPEPYLRRMSEAGVLGRFVPEFGRIIGQTQFNMYHVYTVDEHTLVALGILHSIGKGKLAEEAPLASEIMPRISQTHVLYLALFCHDIAKGRGGDHSELGEKIALKLAARFGFSPQECETTAWLVRNHLYLSNTAFKRDLNDPKTIADFVAFVQTPERLKLLLVMTVADIRAVGAGVWNEWKGQLMRNVYTHAMQAMGATETGPKINPRFAIRQALQERFPTLSEAQIEGYLDMGLDEFWSGCTISQHQHIAKMLLIDQAPDYDIAIHVSHDEKHSVTEIIIATEDRPHIFAHQAGAITLAGATITSAKIFTLNNGRAINIFHIQDMSGVAFDRPSKLAKIAVYVEQAISGVLDLKSALRLRASSYENPLESLSSTSCNVFFENNISSVCSVIEISCRDRVGLLYDIAATLSMLNLSISAAHISTYGTQAADVFYVKDMFGFKIIHPARIKSIRETILSTL